MPRTARLRPLLGGPLLILAAFLLLSSCQSSNLTGPEITLNLGGEPPTLDPAQVTDPPTIQVMRLLFLNLVNLREADGAPIPALATDWRVSSDGLLWEFHLRPNVMWVRYSPTTSRGTREGTVTAEDVVYSVRRTLDPRSFSSFAPLFASWIRNGQAFNGADPRTRPEDLDRLAQGIGVQAIDDHTVQFALSQPNPAFPALVATWLGRVQPRESIEENGPDWTSPGLIWTDGPYLFERWDHKQTIVLRKNPDYYDAANVQIERIRFAMLGDAASVLDAYASGQLNSTDPYDSIEGGELERVNQDPALSADTQIVPSLCTQYIALNPTRPPFDDVRVRQAVAMTVNRQEVVSLLASGEPARWFAHPAALAAPTLSDTIGLPYDPPRAKVILDQAGYGVGKRALPAVTLAMNANDNLEKVGTALSDNWKRTLAADVIVKTQGLGAFLQDLQQDPPEMFRLGFCAPYPDAASFYLDKSLAGLPYLLAHWNLPAFDERIQAAARETDLYKRQDLYRAAEKILVQDEALLIPLVWDNRVVLTNKKIERSYSVMEGFDLIENWRVKTQ